MGFFTDTTVCIGCKACEVACKQWNDLPADGSGFGKRGSYDNTGGYERGDLAPRALRREHRAHARGARRGRPAAVAAAAAGTFPASPRCTWRVRATGRARTTCDLVDWARRTAQSRRGRGAGAGRHGPVDLHVRRVQALHERGLPRRVPDRRADPHRVRDGDRAGRRVQRLRLLHPVVPVRRDRPRPYDGRAAKCTLCYDRLEDGLEPACAKACPTDSIQFGPYDELVEAAKGRVVALHERGVESAYLYGAGDGARRSAGRWPRRLLPADPAARALRAARPGRVADPGERAPRHARGPAAAGAAVAVGGQRAGLARRAAQQVAPATAGRARGGCRGATSAPRAADGRDTTPGARHPRRAGPLASRGRRARRSRWQARVGDAAGPTSTGRDTQLRRRRRRRRQRSRPRRGGCAGARRCPPRFRGR